MSLFSRLFGAPKASDRLRKAEELVAHGELGLARLELQAAVAAPDIDPAAAVRASAQLQELSDALARQRLDDARALVEGGEHDEAERALDVAGGLAPSPPLAAEVHALREALAAGLGLEVRGGGDMRAVRAALAAPIELPADVDRDEGASDERGDAVSEAAAVDPELSSLELALLSFPVDEGDAWAALVARDPAVGSALERQGEGHIEAALDGWRRVSPASSAEPLVLRELGRSLLLANEPEAACPVLERAHTAAAGDLMVTELLAEARLAVGDHPAAVGLANDLLEAGLGPATFGRMLEVLLEAGGAEDALRHIDVGLDRSPKEIALWQLRADLCERLASPEAAAEADATALDLFREQCVRCGGADAFPVRSGRRVAGSMLETASSSSRRELRQLADLLRLLAANDADQGPRWEALLARVEGV